MQLRFLVVDMNAGAIWEVRNDRCIYIGEPHTRMLGEHMASACPAPFAITVRRLVVRADIVCAPRDLHRFGFPQSERVDGSCGPASTRLTMAITHSGRFTADRELNRAAKAAPMVGVSVVHNWISADLR